MLEGIGSALNILLTGEAIGLLILGCLIGYIFGLLPGLGATAALALSLPLVIRMDPIVAMYLLAGIMGSQTCGGAITAILLNTPGTPVNAATCLDGYPMAQKGEAGKALSIAAFSSLFGAVVGVFILVALVPVVRAMIMSFTPPEFFMLCFVGLATVAVAVRGNVIKGLASACAGVLIGFTGYHYMTGAVRFNFGTDYLWDGIPIIPFFIGLFAIGEMLMIVTTGKRTISRVATVSKGGRLDGVKEIWKYKGCFARSSVIGVIIGIIPGIGGAVANFVSYLFGRQFSKTPEKFGTGHPEGVIASETANNAKDGGALLPTLAFGIPGSAEMAVLLGAFTLIGLVAGPTMLLKHLDVMYAIIFGLVISGILATLCTIFLARSFAKVTTIDVSYIVPIVVILAFLGSFALRGSILDVAAAVIFGVIGYIMRKSGFPIISMIIGYVIGRIAENAFLQALAISDGSYAIFFTRPISLTLFVFGLFVLIFPFVKKVGRSDG